MTKSKTYAATIKREERQRMRRNGFILKQLWAHPSDWPTIMAVAKAAKESRETGA